MRCLFVIASFFLVGFVAQSVSAATIGRNPVSATTNTRTTGKSKKIMHQAFATAGTKPGLEIWRVENFEPVAYPKNDYGKFHTGDSYIILNTKEAGGKKTYDVHFWLGQETSQDESGSAAILTVELDSQLSGIPIQYRETQDHESELFLSYFKNGVRYSPGGVASGFQHVDRNAVTKKMYQVKGKKNVRVKQVDLTVGAMNRGDCFILDNGNDIYVYQGINSKRVERLKAASAANAIRDQDHGGRSKVHIIDESSTDDERTKFFEVLGSGNPSQIPDESTGGDDQAFERSEESSVTLYKVSDASGSMQVQKVAQKPLKQQMLDTNDCFILDTEQADIYVWVGKKCNAKEKTEGMAKAESYIKMKKYPSWTRVQRIVEFGEPAVFKQYFQTWQDRGELHPRLIRSADE